MAKALWHSELVKISPVDVTVVSDILHSKHSTPKDPKPDYVTLQIDGGERYYNIENDDCASFFKGRKGQTLTLIAEGSREDARIVLKGGGQTQQRREERHEERPSENRREQQPPATNDGLMRAGEIRYERTVGLPNYSSEKIGITVFIEPGAKAATALAFAKKFVEDHLMKPSSDRR